MKWLLLFGTFALAQALTSDECYEGMRVTVKTSFSPKFVHGGLKRVPVGTTGTVTEGHGQGSNGIDVRFDGDFEDLPDVPSEFDNVAELYAHQVKENLREYGGSSSPSYDSPSYDSPSYDSPSPSYSSPKKSSFTMIIIIIAVVAVAAIGGGILIYCFCCQSDDDSYSSEYSRSRSVEEKRTAVQPAAQPVQVQPAQVAHDRGRRNQLPTPWVEHQDPTGRPYYHNPQTNETRWERPQASNVGGGYGAPSQQAPQEQGAYPQL